MKTARKNPSYRKQTYPCATLCTTNPLSFTAFLPTTAYFFPDPIRPMSTSPKRLPTFERTEWLTAEVQGNALEWGKVHHFEGRVVERGSIHRASVSFFITKMRMHHYARHGHTWRE